MRRLLASLFILLLVPVLVASPNRQGDDPAQDSIQDDRALDSRARYLRVNPYHQRVFQDLLTVLRAQGRLNEWIERYGNGSTAGDVADRVVLARLTAAAGRRLEALAILEGLEDAPPERDALIGDLHLQAGDPQAAIEWLARAGQALGPGDTRDRVLRNEARANLLLGAGSAAAAAFERLVEGSPTDLGLRLEVAELCARGGLREQAIAHYAVAEQLAGADPEWRSKVLAALGALHERELHPERAAEAYQEALDLLGRGHWMEDELAQRLVELHRVRGTLRAWRDSLRQELDRAPGDLTLTERLARVLVATGEAQSALELLGQAAELHGDDLVLAGRRLELARSHGTPAQRIEVLQAALGARPRDKELHFELAEALAEGQRLAAAREQWTLLAEALENDPAGLARVAWRRAAWGDDGVAESLFRRARDLAPGDFGRHGDLARHLAGQGRVQAASDGLVEAERSLDGARALEELAALQRELGQDSRAERPLRRALALLPKDGRLALSLAELLVDLERAPEARPMLVRLIETTGDLGLRARALEVAVDSFRTRSSLAVAAEEQAQLVQNGEADGPRRAPWLLAIAMRERLRDGAGVRELLEGFLVAYPEDRPAREHLVRLLKLGGESEAALAHLGELVRRYPQGARPWRLERTALFAKLHQDVLALAELEAIVAAEPGQRRALEEASEGFASLGRSERAIEVLGRALALEQTDANGHLRMARLCLAGFRLAEAHRHLRLAYRLGSGPVRQEALASLHGLMVGQGRVEYELKALAQELEARPFDLPVAFLIIDLHVAEREYRQALEMLAQQLERRPYEVRLFQRRAGVHGQIGLHEEAVRDLRTVRALVEDPPPELAFELLSAHLAAGQFEAAGRVAQTCEDPLRAARLLGDAGRMAEAAEVLRGAQRSVQGGGAPEPDWDRYLGELNLQIGEEDQAVAAFERYVDGGGLDSTVVRRLGDLYWDRGEIERTLEMGARLLGTAYSQHATRTWFTEKGLEIEWVELRCARVLASPRDGEAVARLAEDLGGDDEQVYPRWIETLGRLALGARRDGVVPPGRSRLAWAHWLRQQELAQLDRSDFAREERLEVARARLGERTPASGGPVENSLDLDLVQLGDLDVDAQAIERLEGSGMDRPLWVLALAEARAVAGQHAQAALSFARLAELLGEADRPRDAQLERRRARRSLAQGARAELPYSARVSLSVAAFEGYLDVVEAAAVFTSGGPPLDVNRAQRRRAEQLVAAGRPEEAAAVIDGVLAAMGQPAALVELAALAGTCARTGLHGRALELARRLDQAVRLPGDASENAAWAEAQTQAARGLFVALGTSLRDFGAGVGAYDLLRDLGRLAEARAVADTDELKRALLANYGREFNRSEADLRAGSEGGSGWWAAARGLHDTAVKLAELYEWSGESAGALGIWRRAEALLPLDPNVLYMKALYAERGDRREEALEARVGVIAALNGKGAPPPEAHRETWLVPQVTPQEPSARRSVTWVHLGNFAARPTQDPRLTHWLARLRLELELGRVGAGLESLGRVVDLSRDPPASWVRNLLHVLGGYGEIQGMAPYLASYYGQLHRLAPSNRQVIDGYVKALWDEDSLDRARDVLADYLAGQPRISSEDRKQLENMVRSTEQLRRLRHGDEGQSEEPGPGR
jgi:tetratricopeptide (TPR) repeat protein